MYSKIDKMLILQTKVGKIIWEGKAAHFSIGIIIEILF